MTHKLIKTDNYLLVVDDSEIKDGDWFLNTLQKNVYKNNIKYYNVDKDYLKKVIAHLPLNNSTILQGIDLLPPLDDVEKLALNRFPRDEDWRVNSDNADKRPIWMDGYNKAKEKFKYTEEDMRGFHKFFMEIGTNSIYDALTLYIQSLSQPKMPVGFDVDYPFVALQSKNVIKTTINSQGQTQWVGKYIY